jgi:hypothetical protein
MTTAGTSPRFMRASIFLRMLAGGIGIFLSVPGINSISTLGRSAAATNETGATQHKPSNAKIARYFESPNLDKTPNAHAQNNTCRVGT